MKSTRGCVAACVLVASLSCGSRPPDDRDYVTQLGLERAVKNTSLRAKGSPIPEDRRADLLPLSYFPIDSTYHVPAGLAADPSTDVVSIPTSTGTQRRMHKAGTLAFLLKDQSLKLTVLTDIEEPDLNHLGVLFTDLTSGTETYGGGRYIDLERNESGVYELDFNRAYNPYCYYNETYECPYPPRENRLPIPIRAGERLKRPNR
jgi:uncharacterized protein (DUF1684 family)